MVISKGTTRLSSAIYKVARLVYCVTAGTTEYLPTRGTTGNDGPAVSDRQDTNRFDTYCAELYNCSENELSLPNDDTTRSDIHGKMIFNVTDGRTETGQKKTEVKPTDRQTATKETRQTKGDCTDINTHDINTAPPPALSRYKSHR